MPIVKLPPFLVVSHEPADSWEEASEAAETDKQLRREMEKGKVKRKKVEQGLREMKEERRKEEQPRAQLSKRKGDDGLFFEPPPPPAKGKSFSSGSSMEVPPGAPQWELKSSAED